MKLTVLALLASWQVAPAQTIEVVSPQPDSVSVTIYRDLFALVTETRTIDLPEGPVTLSFDGVVETLLPSSAVATELGRTLEERNLDYDPLTPNNLLAQSIGKSVTITRTLPGSGKVVQSRAVILAANAEGVTLRTEDGNEALHCSGLPERLSFDEIPGDLRPRPRLSIRLAAGKPGKRTIRLSYLAHGFSWNSDYVARVDQAGTRMDLTGWITLRNHTNANFRDAQVQVVAGKLHLLSTDKGGSSLAGNSDDYHSEQDMQSERDAALEQMKLRIAVDNAPVQLFGGCYASPEPLPRRERHFANAELEEVIVTGHRASMLASMDVQKFAMAIREELGDYQLYRLPWATDLNARQTKQAVFLRKPRVKVEHFYSFGFDALDFEFEESRTPRSVFAFENRKSAGLGEPLPAGKLRVFEISDTGDRFVGEAEMEDRPANTPQELRIASALDLGVDLDVRLAGREELDRDEVDDRADVTLRAINAKGVPVTLEIRQRVYEHTASAKVLNASQRAGRKYGDYVWRLKMPANGSQLLTYRFEVPEEEDEDEDE